MRNPFYLCGIRAVVVILVIILSIASPLLVGKIRMTITINYRKSVIIGSRAIELGPRIKETPSDQESRSQRRTLTMAEEFSYLSGSILRSWNCIYELCIRLLATLGNRKFTTPHGNHSRIHSDILGSAPFQAQKTAWYKSIDKTIRRIRS